MALLPRGIGPRINLSLIAFALVLGLAMAALVAFGFHRTQDNATRQSERGLELFAEETMQSFSVQVSESANQSALEASDTLEQAAGELVSLRLASAGLWDPARLEPVPGGALRDSASQGGDAWIPAGADVTAATGDLAATAALEAMAPSIVAAGKDPARYAAIYFVGASGAVRYYSGAKLPDAAFDVRATDWPAFLKTVPAADPDRKTVWIGPHVGLDGKTRMLTVATPVYEGPTFRGTLAFDLPESNLIAQLDGIHPTAEGIGFALDVDGNLFANDRAAPIAAAANDPAIADVLTHMRAGETGRALATVGGQQMIIGYAPMQGLGKSVALMAPVSAVTAVGDASGVRDSITTEGNRTVVLTLGVLALLLVGALGIAAYLNRKFLLKPIAGLVAGTRAVAAGDLQTEIPVRSNDELGVLAGSFNEMTTMLRRRDYALQTEIVQKERAQSELNALFSAMTDLVFVIDRTGTYIRVGPTSAQSRADQVRVAGKTFWDFFPKDEADALLAVVLRTLERQTTQTIEYKAILVDGEERGWLAGSASPLTADTVVWVARDITEMVQSRHLLEQRVAEQTHQLAALLEMSQTASSSLELQPLVDLILARLQEVVPCRGGASLLIRRGEFVEMVQTGSMRSAGTPAPRYPASGLIYEQLERREAVRIADLWANDPVAEDFRAAQGAYLEGIPASVHSFMAVPLAVSSRVFGAIVMARDEPDAFSPRDVDIAVALANQAAVAYQNAELLGQSERRARENEALSRISATLTFDRPTESTMDAIAEAILSATTARAAGVIVAERATGRLRMVGGRGLAPGYLEAVGRAWDAGASTTSIEVAESGQSTIIHGARQQMLDDPAYAPLHPFLREVEWDTVAVLPLHYHGRAVGALNVCYAADADPSPEEQAFLHVIAGQAATAVENVQLYNETELRARQNEALSRIASALTFNQPAEVTFATLARRVVEGSDSIACAVVLKDEEGDLPYVVGTYGMPGSYGEDIGAAWRAGADGATNDVLRSGKMRILRNGRERILAEPLYAPIHRHWLDAPWDLAALVPLAYRGRTVGSLACYYAKGVEPGAEELALLAAVADQAAVAVENARLFAHSESRVRELEAVARIASNFTFQQSLDAMMDEVAAQIVQASRSAISCTITLANPESFRSLRVLGTFGMPVGLREALEAAWRNGAPSATRGTLRGRNTRVIRDAKRQTLGQPGYEAAFDLIRNEPWDTLAMFPMIYQDHAIGLIIVGYPTEDEPNAEELAFLEGVADQAAVAVENARLFTQAQSLAVIEERQRLSRELHDSVSQALYGISLGAQTARELFDSDPQKAVEPMEYVLSLAEAGIAEMRALIFELRPEALAAEGLLGALRKQAASMRARHALTVDTRFEQEPDLPLASKEALYRIAQESLHNVVKHAGATSVRLELFQEEGEVVLVVADDGKGFEVKEDYPGHLGLRSMRERTLHVGGHVEIESGAGKGTTIRARLPLPRDHGATPS